MRQGSCPTSHPAPSTQHPASLAAKPGHSSQYSRPAPRAHQSAAAGPPPPCPRPVPQPTLIHFQIGHEPPGLCTFAGERRQGCRSSFERTRARNTLEWTNGDTDTGTTGGHEGTSSSASIGYCPKSLPGTIREYPPLEHTSRGRDLVIGVNRLDGIFRLLERGHEHKGVPELHIHAIHLRTDA